MNKQDVINYAISITSPGQKEYFQILLPRDLERIIGFEVGVTFSIPPPVRAISFIVHPPPVVDARFRIFPNVHFGRLVMQMPGCPGIFYQGDVVEDGNIHAGESIGEVLFQPTLWSHNRKKTELTLDVANPDFIEGFFWNEWSASQAYRLNIHLWYNRRDS
jgi:hypothetical protein